MTIVTNEHGQQNMFAKEPTMYITEKDLMDHEEMTYAERAQASHFWCFCFTQLISYLKLIDFWGVLLLPFSLAK
jgi:hypothetical protein